MPRVVCFPWWIARNEGQPKERDDGLRPTVRREINDRCREQTLSKGGRNIPTNRWVQSESSDEVLKRHARSLGRIDTIGIEESSRTSQVLSEVAQPRHPTALLAGGARKPESRGELEKA